MSTKTKINLRGMSMENANEHLQRFVREIAEFLPGWKYEQPEYAHRARLVAVDPKNGPTVVARIEGGRIVFHGMFPAGAMQKVSLPSNPPITADINRDPRLVANQITNRLLSHYLPAYHEVDRQLRMVEQGEAYMTATAERLSDAAGGWNIYEGRQFTVWGPSNDGGYADVKVCYGGKQVNVDCRGVTEEQAKKILAIIREG